MIEMNIEKMKYDAIKLIIYHIESISSTVLMGYIALLFKIMFYGEQGRGGSVVIIRYFFTLPNRKTATPKIPETTEAIMMPNFESSVSSGEEKDKPEINSDMVNPIPPRMLAPMIWFHVIPEYRGVFSSLMER